MLADACQLSISSGSHPDPIGGLRNVIVTHMDHMGRHARALHAVTRSPVAYRPGAIGEPVSMNVISIPSTSVHFAQRSDRALIGRVLDALGYGALFRDSGRIGSSI